MATYGRKRSSDSGFGLIATGKKRGVVFGALSQNGWLYAIGFLGGHAVGSGNPSVVAAVHEWSGSAPGARICYANPVSVTAIMTSGTEGQQYEPSLDVVDVGPSNLAAQVYSGQRYVIDLLPSSVALGHGMVPAADSPESNTNFYENSDANVPDDPFGAASATNQGTMTAWFLYDANDAPLEPINRTPSGTITTLTPVFEGDYRDPNAGNGGTNRGDKMKQFDLELREVGQTSLKWNQAYNAGPQQQADKRFSKSYDGSALVEGHSYEWRCRVSDQFGLWGDWSSWLQFDIPASGIGVVTLDGTPTGYQSVNPTGYQGRWSHPSGLSTNAVQMRILTPAGSVVAESGIITKTVASSGAPGTLFTITSPGDTSINTFVDWNAHYDYQIKGRDTNGNWSSYSAKRRFKMDFAPAVPTVVSPKNFKQITVLEPLIATCSDPDSEDPTSSLVVKCQIKEVTPQLANASADVNTTGWGNDPNGGSSAGITYALSRDTSIFDSTPGAFKINVSASTAGAGSIVNQLLTANYIAVEPGASYQFVYKLRADTTNIHPHLYIRWYDAAQVYLSVNVEADIAPAAINTWYERTVTFTAPANAKFARIGIQGGMTTASLTGNYWWDTIVSSPAIRRIRQMPWNAGETRFKYTPVAEDCPNFGTYWWDAYSYDGVLYSGTTQTEANAQKSAQGSFLYGAGPTVTITAPADLAIVTTSTLLVSWSTTGQVKYRVWLTEAGESEILYDTGLVTDAVSASHTIPSGYHHNGRSYDVHVQIDNSVPLSGFDTKTFSVSYTPPAVVQNVQVLAIPADDADPYPTAISVSWDPSTETGFDHYLVSRRAESGPDMNTVILARIYDPSQIVLIDPNPASGHTYIYGVSQVITVGADELASDVVEDSASLIITGAILTDVTDGVTYRIVLQKADRAFPRVVSEQIFENLAGTKPTTVRNATYYDTPQIEAMLIDDPFSSAYDKMIRLKTLDARHPTVCYRDSAGRKDFAKIEACEITDKLPGWYSASIRLRGEAYQEGSDV